MSSTAAIRSHPLNFTPHAVNIVTPEGQPVVTYMSLGALRLEQQLQTELYHCGDESGPVAVVTAPVYNGLAKPLPDAFLRILDDPDSSIIVSMVTAQWFADAPFEQHRFRGAVLTPDSSPAGTKRDAKGQQVGTLRLVQYVAAKSPNPAHP